MTLDDKDERISTLAKNFDALYRAALDVSDSEPGWQQIAGGVLVPTPGTPPHQNLRAQLERLRPAFDEIQAIKRTLIESERPTPESEPRCPSHDAALERSHMRFFTCGCRYYLATP